MSWLVIDEMFALEWATYRRCFPATLFNKQKCAHLLHDFAAVAAPPPQSAPFSNELLDLGSERQDNNIHICDVLLATTVHIFIKCSLAEVSTIQLAWSDAHMQSHAKMHHVAVFIWNVVRSNLPNVRLEFKSTPRVNKFRVSSCSVSVAIGLPRLRTGIFGPRCVQMTTMHSAVLILASSNNHSNLTLLVL